MPRRQLLLGLAAPALAVTAVPALTAPPAASLAVHAAARQTHSFREAACGSAAARRRAVRCGRVVCALSPAYDSTMRYAAVDWAKNLRTLPVTHATRLRIATGLTTSATPLRLRRGTASRTPLSPRTPLHRPDLDHPQAHLLAAPLQRSRHGALSHTHLRHTNSHLLKAEAATSAVPTRPRRPRPRATRPLLLSRRGRRRRGRPEPRVGPAALQSPSNLRAISEQSRSNLPRRAAHPRPTYARPTPDLQVLICASQAFGGPLQPLPPLPHQLLGSALGLLLVFRTNAAYDRFWEARDADEMRTRCGRDADESRGRER